jgi:Domain of unknown function (DUF4333)
VKVLGAALVAAVLALALAACGETVIDATKTEDSIKAELERSAGIEVAAIDCPSDVEVKAGETFDCTLTEKGGDERPVKLEIANEDADLKLLNTSSFE